MGFWEILNNLSDSTQFPKKWNQYINWIFLIQLIIALGSCYINKYMWPSRKIIQSGAVYQIKIMLILQIVLFYWEITFTNMIHKDFNIVEHHLLMMLHSALLLYFENAICGNALLLYLFYSIIWTFGGGSNQFFFFLYITYSFLYIFQTLYAYKLPKTLFIGFPILALIQTFSNYKYYCWSIDGSLCPTEKTIYIFGTNSLSYIVTYLIIISVIFSITVLPFYACLKKLEEKHKDDMTIIDSIESNSNNSSSSSISFFGNLSNRNSFKNK
ncbi:hypothetical protein BCR36DRAFT_409218 [Piromyces finnis]|uniref:Transmembrane protein n=1 Tax=Piromyces finnis TaxID=1754191 RepID=A0A1Y1VJ48_9FUNG|nr:hypothetical protein BCR36DRAFT_409218 [Piromyces finnis]|eukprot:ORX57739.1 hypothetical protein BCR36DRAFT_409218 [Piromyces finnis]